MVEPCDIGQRNRIVMPSGQNYYLLSFPFSPKDYFQAKVPFENRDENREERQAVDLMLDIINDQVFEVISTYDDQIADLEEKIKNFESFLGLDKPRSEQEF